MGDRANVVIQDEDGNRVWLYSHWGGFDMLTTLRNALTRGKERWDDPAYLARIVFCEMMGPKAVNDTGGFGISAVIGDNERPILVCDCKTQTVRLEDEADGHLAGYYPCIGAQFTFLEFIDTTISTWADIPRSAH